MLNVTERAAKILVRTLRDGDATAWLGFRVVPTGPGVIAFTLDEAREGDEVFRHEDQTVLVVDPWIAQMLDGAVLDVEEQAGGTSLTLYGSGRPEGY
jgi:Fe-S cluster assembly iron-binding protein IscA